MGFGDGVAIVADEELCAVVAMACLAGAVEVEAADAVEEALLLPEFEGAVDGRGLRARGHFFDDVVGAERLGGFDDDG